MIKHNASGGTKLLIMLIGLLFSATIAFGVVWSTQFMGRNRPAAQPPAVTRMKIQAPSKRFSIKAPPALPDNQGTEDSRVPAASPAESAAQAPETAATGGLPLNDGDQAAADSEGLPTRSDAPTQPPAPPASMAEPDAPPVADTEAGTMAAGEPALPVAADTERHAPTADAGDADHQAPLASAAQAPQSGADPQEPNRAFAGGETDAAVQPPAGQAAPAPAFRLQVGAYRVPEYARDAVAKLAQRGYAADIVAIEDARQRTWYMVRLEGFQTRAEAARGRDRFMQQEQLTAVIAKTGQI